MSFKICGKKTPGSTRPCQRTVRKGQQHCHMHGGEAARWRSVPGPPARRPGRPPDIDHGKTFS